MKRKKILLTFFIFYFLFFIFSLVQAQIRSLPPAGEPDAETLKLLEDVAKKADYPVQETDPVLIVVRLVNYFLGFLGVLATLVIIYGGFLWMTAAGNEEKVSKGKKTLIQGLNGLIIVILSYLIYNFVIELFKSGKSQSGGIRSL